MRNKVIIILIIATIAVLLLLITALFFTSVIRRVYKGKKYRELDHFRAIFGKKIRESLESGTVLRTQSEFSAHPKSDAWQAIEDILLSLINEDRYRDEVMTLLSALGYISFHEKQIENRNIQVRALSIDKLGRMKSEASVLKLIPLLDAENPEIVSVSLRALSKIGGPVAMQAIIERMSVILDRSIVTRKAMGMALQTFGADAISFLVEQKAGRDNLWVLSCILDILSRLPADPRSVQLAAGHLSSSNVEVRSKALKVLGRAENVRMVHNLPELILPLLEDPVWFVRLQAIRSIGALGYEGAMAPIGKLIFDENWQVRNEAARALTAFGERALDLFLEVLTGTDTYAKDSICEEIEKADFSEQLIKNVIAGDPGLQKKSRTVLEIMLSRGFSTPLSKYLEQEGDEAGKRLIRSMVRTGPGA